MSSNGRRLAIVSVGAALGVVAVWWIASLPEARWSEPEAVRDSSSVTGPASPLSEDGETGESGPDTRADLLPPTGIVPATGSTPTWLGFRSSAGLPLASVELEIEERSWQRRPLENGRCTADGLHLPLRARGPGHLPALVTRVDEEVLLEPDALFFIEGRSLRTCLREIRPLGAWTRVGSPYRDLYLTQIAERLSFGFVDKDRWALAATPRELSDFGILFGERRIEINLEWRDRRTGYVWFNADEGARAVWEAPCDGLAATAALDVALERPEAAPRGEVEFHLRRAADSLAQPTVRKEPWGQIQLEAPERRYVGERRPPDADRIRIADVPLGLEWFLVARDLSSGAVGFATFVHDGRPQKIVLTESIVLRGRVSAPQGFPPPTAARFHWQESDLDYEGWIRSNWRRIPLDLDGVFELRGWENPPYKAKDWLPPPPAVALVCEAPGFERLAKSVAVDSLGSGDAGLLVLRPRLAQIHLAPGHHLGELDLQYSTVRISSMPAAVWEIVDGRPTLEGGLDLCLETEGVDPEGRPLTVFTDDETRKERRAAVFPPVPFDALLLDYRNREGFAFLRATGGGFERVPDRVYEVEVDCRAVPAHGWSWTVRWSWRGMTQNIDWLGAGSIGEHRDLRCSAPEEGTELRWLASDSRDSSSVTTRFGSGSVALDAPRVRIQVP